MLEITVDDTVTLDAQDSVVTMDNWACSRFALHANTAYAASANTGLHYAVCTGSEDPPSTLPAIFFPARRSAHDHADWSDR